MSFFEIEKSNFAKAVVYSVADEPVVVIIPGDRELNETKLCNYLGVSSHEIEMANEDMIFFYY